MKCIFLFSWSSSLHVRLHLKALSTKPMFKINEPLLIPKNTWVMWHNIWWHVMEYLATSLENFHVENEYIKNIPWHGMECSQRFCLAHVRLLICSPATVVGHQHALRDVYFWRGESIGWRKHSPKGCFLSFVEGDGGLISIKFPSNSSCSHQYPIKILLFPSSSQTFLIKFLLFPSITHQNPFVPIKFPSKSFCSHCYGG
jgi:hypothetical protein